MKTNKELERKMNNWELENNIWINHDTKQIMTVEEFDNLRCQEISSLWKQKNHWWRIALHHGEALREISKKIGEESQDNQWTPIDAATMHEIAEKALEYEPPND